MGIQQIEGNLIKLLGDNIEVLRIDSDTHEKTTTLYQQINTSDIVITTQIGNSIIHPEI